jgi:hypothetical protein
MHTFGKTIALKASMEESSYPPHGTESLLVAVVMTIMHIMHHGPKPDGVAGMFSMDWNSSFVDLHYCGYEHYQTSFAWASEQMVEPFTMQHLSFTMWSASDS